MKRVHKLTIFLFLILFYFCVGTYIYNFFVNKENYLRWDFDPYDRTNSWEEESKFETLFTVSSDEQRHDYEYKVTTKDYKSLRSLDKKYNLKTNLLTHIFKQDKQIISLIGSLKRSYLIKAYSRFDKLKNKKLFKGRNILLISSPGGSQDEVYSLVYFLKTSNIKIDTYIPTFAGSSAALLFLAGEHRIMKKNAKIMFHEAHTSKTINEISFYISRHDAKSLREKKEFPSNSKNLNLRNQKKLKALGKWEEASVSLIREAYFMPYDPDTNIIINYISEKLDKSEAFVTTYLIKPNKDVILTAEEALTLGVATDIID